MKKKLFAFDTRDKKPTVWNIAVLSAVCILLVLVLSFFFKGDSDLPVLIVIDLSLAGALYLLIDAFFKQIEYNPYSYNTIYYSGFALFVLSVLLTFILLTFRCVSNPAYYGMDSAVLVLLGSSRTYMLLSFPFILIFSAALCISNISLIRHEGRRFVNILGIILSFLLLAGEIFIWRFDFYASGSIAQIRLHEFATCFLAGIYLYFECMLIGAIFADVIAAKYEPPHDKDYIIILGCRNRKDGTLTPLLRGRVDRALAFYRAQKEETGKEAVFIPSGGQGPGETVSESASMKQYLIEQGIPESRIITEDKSGNTFENMLYSKEKIGEDVNSKKIAFSTTNYHVFRSGLYARRVKMRAVGMGARTKWYFWPNAAVREFVGILTEHRGKQALIFGGMITAYFILVMLAYR